MCSSDLEKKIVVTWKIVAASKASVLYIYIDNNNNNNKNQRFVTKPGDHKKVTPGKESNCSVTKLGNVGELTEWDKICKNEKNKCKRQRFGSTIKSLGLRDLSGRLSRSTAGRLWVEECPHWGNHQHGGY